MFESIEIAVVQAKSEGLTDAETGDRVDLTEDQVSGILSGIFAKVGINRISAVVYLFIKAELIIGPAMVAAPSRWLSDVERDVIDLAKRGDTNQQIADTIERSSKTVKRHIENALKVYGAKNRAHLIALTLLDGTIK